MFQHEEDPPPPTYEQCDPNMVSVKVDDQDEEDENDEFISMNEWNQETDIEGQQGEEECKEFLYPSFSKSQAICTMLSVFVTSTVVAMLISSPYPLLALIMVPMFAYQYGEIVAVFDQANEMIYVKKTRLFGMCKSRIPMGSFADFKKCSYETKVHHDNDGHDVHQISIRYHFKDEVKKDYHWMSDTHDREASCGGAGYRISPRDFANEMNEFAKQIGIYKADENVLEQKLEINTQKVEENTQKMEQNTQKLEEMVAQLAQQNQILLQAIQQSPGAIQQVVQDTNIVNNEG